MDCAGIVFFSIMIIYFTWAVFEIKKRRKEEIEKEKKRVRLAEEMLMDSAGIAPEDTQRILDEGASKDTTDLNHKYRHFD